VITHVSNNLAGLVLSAAAVIVTAAAVHLPAESGTGQVSGSTAAPAYPHNINPDPNGPYYLNPYDPYQQGYPVDVTPPVLGVDTPSDGEPLHPPKHR